MPKPEAKTPCTDDLRALSRAILLAQLSEMSESSGGGDPTQRALQIKAALMNTEHGQTYTWLRARLPIDKEIQHQRNPGFAELEIIRAAADATGDFLRLTATTARERVASLRQTREAIVQVLNEVNLSDAARAELSYWLGWLSRLDAISAKGRLREQLLLYSIFERMQGWTDTVVAATLTPLFVTLTGTPAETAGREIRRWLKRYRGHFTDLRAVTRRVAS